MAVTVLFLCVENSCRSQMAEGFARQLGKGVMEAWSAGSKPSGRIHPTAVEVMRERGIDLSAQASKGLSDLPSVRWDYVVTMGCGDACPFVPAKALLDWSLSDPKDAPKEDFLRTRDAIERNVRALIRAVAQGLAP